MRKITLLGSLLFSMVTTAQVTVAGTSFEDIALFSGQYTDTGDAVVAHTLTNNMDEPQVNAVATMNEIGYAASYSPYDVAGSGLTDGDSVGVTDFTGNVGSFTNGTQGYQFTDTDGTMILEFDIVDFDGFVNNMVSVDYFVNDTGYEGDGSVNDSDNDVMRIYVKDLTNTNEIDILNTQGTDIDDLMIEGAWITGTAMLPDGVQAQLVVEVRTNSDSEGLSLDNIVFSGEEPLVTPEVTFEEAYMSVAENGTMATITVALNEAPSTDGSVDVYLTTFGTAQEGVDFQFSSTETLNFTADDVLTRSFNITLMDNNDDGSDVYFVLGLENPVNTIIGEQDIFSVYILDDDTVVPAEDTTPLDASLLTSYLVDGEGTAEIVAYDPIQQSLFVTNGAAVEVLDFSDPNNINNLISGDVSMVGDNVQSVAVSNGLVAVAVSNFDGTQNGFVVFASSDINSSEEPVIVEVGVLPDMVTFTPDGTKLLVANEGEPNDDYSIDPEGSVSIIDVTGGLSEIDQFDVVNLNFNAFDGMEDTFNAQGIRIYGPGASVSKDLEPEYIAVSADSETAYVVLQENNAYAIIDIENATITDIISFGLKDHSLSQNSLDVSDETDFVFNASWPVKGMYMPDGISTYTVNGVDYIVTANEGDAREYDAFEEEFKIDDEEYVLDAEIFGDVSILELESNLAEINVTGASGDLDGDGDYDEIHVFGGRSFSIFEATTGNLVYDSGNDFEVITANHPEYGAIFNTSNSNNKLKNRSDNKGPEPESVLVQEIDGEYYAFILLERIGGVMIYNISNPESPQFLQYLNNRDTTVGGDESGDLGPEGIIYIAPEENSLNKGLLVVANEVSATLSVYQLDEDILSVNDVEYTSNVFTMYPNPTSGIVTFNTTGTYNVYDITGRKVLEALETSSIDASSLTAGTYIVQNEQGQARKLIVK